MQPFSEEELQYLENVFGLTRENETKPVRDGFITRGDMVWWRSLDGPENIDSTVAFHWANITAHPELYQKAKPTIQVTYLS